MWKNFLLVSLRKMIRDGLFSLLNVLALSLSMAVCLIIIVIITNQNNYDQFLSDKNNAYRVNTSVVSKENDKQSFATSPISLSAYITRYPDIKTATKIISVNYAAIETETKTLTSNGFFADPNFFQIFNYSFRHGSFQGFTDPKSIIITYKYSQLFFGSNNPLGEILKVGNFGSYKIIGVIDNDKNLSHLGFDFLISSNSIPVLEKQKKIDFKSDDLSNYLSSYTYISVKNGMDKAEVNRLLAETSQTVAGLTKYPNKEKSVTYEAQRVVDIVPIGSLILENGHGLSKAVLLVSGLSVFFLLILACFNYANLTIAKNMSRMKEVGVRRVLGASQRQIVIQFIFEAVVIALIALLISIILLPFIPLNSVFNNLYAESNWGILLIFYFLLFAICVGIIAGFLPGLLLAKLKFIEILRNSTDLKVFKTLSFRKALTLVQFVVSFVLVTVLTIILKQMNYMKNSDYGFEMKNIVNVSLPDSTKYSFYKNVLAQNSKVQEISAISTLFGSQPTNYVNISLKQNGTQFALANYYVNETAIHNFGLKIISGENFNTNSTQTQLIINEQAQKKLNLSGEIFGRHLYIGKTDCIITGIVKDFHYGNFKVPIQPMCLIYNINQVRIMNVKFNNIDRKEINRTFNSLQKRLNSKSEMQYDLFEDSFNEQQSHTEDSKMIGFITVIMIVLAILGLLGMASYTVNVKRQEVVIRKILGASYISVFLLLSKDYIRLLIISAFIGISIGVILGIQFLHSYYYRINISFEVVTISLLSVSALGFLSFGIQTLKLSLISPSKHRE